MPGTTLPHITHYVPPHPTKEDLDWVDLPIVDISKANTAEGRAELALSVRDAMRTVGFLYVINHGMTPAQTERIVDVADVLFTQVTEDEMKSFDAQTEHTGSRIGYKPRQRWTINDGVCDQNEQYAFHRTVFEHEYPKAFQPFLPEIRAFAEHNHFNVLHPILRMLALGMELPEETFMDLHEFNAVGESHLRFIKYHPRSEEDELKSRNVWLKGHTDVGTVTVLWSQPVSGLQIMSPDGRWRWVPHIENALVINIGDSMEMLSGGFYKGTIHRVVQPPQDQRGFPRLGAYYFAMANDDVKLVPFIQSPALQRVGVARKIEDAHTVTMGEWRRGRARTYGFAEMTQKDDGVEEEIVEGIVVKHYN